MNNLLRLLIYFNVSEFQCLCEKYHEKTLKGAKELTEFRGVFFAWIIPKVSRKATKTQRNLKL